MDELYDVFPLFKGYKTKILKSVSPQVKKDILKTYDEFLEQSVYDKDELNRKLDWFLECADGLKILYCSRCYGVKEICGTLTGCRYCRKYTKDVIVRYIKQPGNEKYLPLIKRRKKDGGAK